jgi:hypothetical protein
MEVVEELQGGLAKVEVWTDWVEKVQRIEFGEESDSGEVVPLARMLEGGGGTNGKLLLDDVVLLVLRVKVEELCSGVSTTRPSGGGWRPRGTRRGAGVVP